MSDNKFNDPLDELIAKHSTVLNDDSTIDTSQQTNVNETVVDRETPSSSEIIDVSDDQINETLTDDTDDMYGDNANKEAFDEANRADEIKRDEMFAAAKAERENQVKTAMPPQEYDMAEKATEVEFQMETLHIVSNMVQRVVTSKGITSGGVPDKDKNKVMGDLVEWYHNNGDAITPEFEKLVLSNWDLDDGRGLAINNIDESTGKIKPDTTESSTDVDVEHTKNSSTTDNTRTDVRVEEAVINVNVPTNTPVNVVVDGDVVSAVTHAKKVNINVNEVTERNITARRVIENCGREDIIKPFRSKMLDTPVTLPLSAYRCTVRPINWSDTFDLIAPDSKTPADAELKKWSVIFDHIANVSIGDFTDFDEFLKKTKYYDGDLLIWAFLVSMSDENAEISMECRHKNCECRYTHKYNPRSLVHVDPAKISPAYTKTHDVAPGLPAQKHYEENNIRMEYQLPNSGYIVEINAPSAYDYITKIMNVVSDIYDAVDPDTPREERNTTEDPRYGKANYWAAHAMVVSAITIIGTDKDGKETYYRFTDWDKIKEIIETMDLEDTEILLKLVSEARDRTLSPVSFYLENVECPKCHYISEKVNIPNIAEQLVFHLSRRLQNTSLNLITMPSK